MLAVFRRHEHALADTSQVARIALRADKSFIAQLLDKKGDEMQTKAAGATREEQHSLAPIQLESTSLERDLASIKRGQGSQLLLALLGSLLAMLVLLLWMTSSDGGSGYASAAKHLDSLYDQQTRTFKDCTLLQPQASPQALRSAIEAASQHFGKAYETQLASCSRALVVFERQLAGLGTSIGMEHRFDGLERATSELNRAIGRYRSYLFEPKRAFDVPTARPYIDDMIAAWSDYDVQRRNTYDVLGASTQTAQAPR
jgi:hypothetical protein